MKRKHRKIIVDNVEYAWTIGGYDEDHNTTFVNVWLNKKVIKSVGLKDTSSITPKIVEGIIRNNVNAA